MQLDELLSDSTVTLAHRDFTQLMPSIADELAYIALCGYIGQLPDQKSPGTFQMGALVIRYQWIEGKKSKGTAVLTHPARQLVIVNAELQDQDFDLSVVDLANIWGIVREHGDSVALGDGDARSRWIEKIANQYRVTNHFIQNLLKFGPQLRRLLS
jgi:hypothetical protein